ncbi:MAG: nuclear transport factor 2 family protein [Alphaproteobacteria bacterium]|nr:nuclear transport factor 2 family protein [Alphaproteobacteria bacterium]
MSILSTVSVRAARPLFGISLAAVLLAGCDEAAAPADGASSDLEARVTAVEDREALRHFVLSFAHIVDYADIDALGTLGPALHPDFQLNVVDFDGHEYVFEGADGLIDEYGPIMVSAQANLAVSAIDVELDGDYAIASFKFINSVTPPPELGTEVDDKVLLLADNTATFVREDGVWLLESLELVHSLAYPGSF